MPAPFSAEPLRSSDLGVKARKLQILADERTWSPYHLRGLWRLGILRSALYRSHARRERHEVGGCDMAMFLLWVFGGMCLIPQIRLHLWACEFSQGAGDALQVRGVKRGGEGRCVFMHPLWNGLIDHARPNVCAGSARVSSLTLCETQKRVGRTSVDSKLSCPVYVAYDLSGSSLRVFQPRANIWSRTVALGSTIGGMVDL